MALNSKYTVIYKRDVKEDLFLKLEKGSIFIFAQSIDDSVLLSSSKNPNLDEFFNHAYRDILNYFNNDVSNINIKIIGPQGEINNLKSEFLREHVHVEKLVVRNFGADLIFVTNDNKIRISKKSYIVPLKAVREPLKLLIVDDSKTIRTLIHKIVSTDPTIEVIGSIGNPLEVLPFIENNMPDVITMDIHMPHMNGVELLKLVHSKYSIPTIMVSSVSMEEGPSVLEALENGAFDYLQKPSMKEISTIGGSIIEKIHAAKDSRLKLKNMTKTSVRIKSAFNMKSLVLIGSSTGGTEALKHILTSLPEEIPPILIVQHIPPVFSKAFAERLNRLCPFLVKEAKDGDKVEPNTVYIAPGDFHMMIMGHGEHKTISLNQQEHVNRFRPSVDVLFRSAKKNLDQNTVALILTGMGKDGAQGLKELHDLGVSTIAQDEESCVVFGMPREAIKLNAADHIEHLDNIAEKLVDLSQTNIKKIAN